MAQASCSYNAPRRALLASVWPQGMGAGTQVGPLHFWAPLSWVLSKPVVPVAVVRGMFWSLAEQWSFGLGEPLTEKTGVLPIGALSGESQCGAAGGGSCRQASLHCPSAVC